MTLHAGKTLKHHEGTDPINPMFNLFAKNDGFWWPYRSFAKALLRTQKNTSAYLEANRKLIDEMREIIRKEQDFALEISRKTISEIDLSPKGGIATDRSEVNAIFEQATLGLRELGEAWMNAQIRSLDAMRSYASRSHKSAGTGHHDSSAAA
jgi:hypothetical protein